MDEQQRRETSAEVLNRTAGSFDLAVSPAIMGAFGFWIDSMLGIVPVLTVTLVVLGFAGACCKLYFDYQRRMAEHDARRQATSEGSDRAPAGYVGGPEVTA